MSENNRIRELIDDTAWNLISTVIDYCNQNTLVLVNDHHSYFKGGKTMIALRVIRDSLLESKRRVSAGVSWEDKELIDAHYRSVFDMVAALDRKWSDELGRYYGKLVRAVRRAGAAELKQADRFAEKLLSGQQNTRQKPVGYCQSEDTLAPVYDTDVAASACTEAYEMVGAVENVIKPHGLTFGMEYAAKVVDFQQAVAHCLATPECHKYLQFDIQGLIREQQRRRGAMVLPGIEFEETYRPRRLEVDQ